LPNMASIVSIIPNRPHQAMLLPGNRLPPFSSRMFDVAARFDHLKPTQVLDGFVRTFNGLVHRVLDGRGGSAGEFDEFIDRVFHIRLFRYRKEQSRIKPYDWLSWAVWGSAQVESAQVESAWVESAWVVTAQQVESAQAGSAQVEPEQ
jgi:hypothetical protein